MFRNIFRLEHLLTPVAVVKCYRHDGYGNNPVNFRTLHIFGLRVAYWTVA